MSEHFKVGDQLYWAVYKAVEQKTIPCPVCYGERKVTLRLGNGDAVELPCEYCRKGYDDPRGVVAEYVEVCEARPVTVTLVRSEETASGIERGYHVWYDGTDSWCPPEDDLFRTEAKALARAKEKAEQARKERERKTEYLKEKANRSFAWNAGYHLRAAKKARGEAEWHEHLAVLCKARAKEATDA